jgi:hypothetical protein
MDKCLCDTCEGDCICDICPCWERCAERGRCDEENDEYGRWIEDPELEAHG